MDYFFWVARNPGRVLSCAEIRRATPNWAAVDDHAIEQAVSRLRRTLHHGDLIQTVMRRGYRLAGWCAAAATEKVGS